MHSSNENDHHLISHDSSSHPSTLILKKRYDTKHCLARKLILARRTQGRRQIYLLFSQFHSISFTSSNARKHCIYASLYDNRNHTDKQNISPPSPRTRSTIFHQQQIFTLFRIGLRTMIYHTYRYVDINYYVHIEKVSLSLCDDRRANLVIVFVSFFFFEPSREKFLIESFSAEYRCLIRM